MLPRLLLARCAQNFPNKIAYYCGEQSRTWGEMNKRSDALAAALQALGVSKGDVTAILGFETFEIYEHFFACMKIGAIRVGINRRAPALGILHMLRDSAAKLLLVHVDFLPHLEPIRPELEAMHITLLHYGGNRTLSHHYENLVAEGGSPLLPNIANDDPLFYSYSSGTTGTPKGIVLTQEGAVASIFQSMIARGMTQDDIWYSPSQSSWMTVLMMMFGLCNGMSHVLPEGEFDIDRFLGDIERIGVTVASMLPTVMQRVLKRQRVANYDLSSLRMISYGSAPAPLKLVREAYDLLGCDLMQAYGSTEAGGWVTHLTAADHRLAIESEPSLLASAGRAGTLYDICIMDEEGNQLDCNGIGEVCIRGKSLMKGYLNLPELTAEARVGDWLRTNDLGRIDERGYLYLIDRKKFMIISGAVNVFPAGVEAILHQHPAIEEASVVGMPHPEWGEAVVAVLRLKAGEPSPTNEELFAFCQARLSKPECPKVFVYQEIPRSTNGKPDKNSLKKALHERPTLFPWNLSGVH